MSISVEFPTQIDCGARRHDDPYQPVLPGAVANPVAVCSLLVRDSPVRHTRTRTLGRAHRLFDVYRDRFFAAEAVVAAAPEDLDDPSFAELVAARNRAARVRNAGHRAAPAIKLYALDTITSEQEAG